MLFSNHRRLNEKQEKYNRHILHLILSSKKISIKTEDRKCVPIKIINKILTSQKAMITSDDIQSIYELFFNSKISANDGNASVDIFILPENTINGILCRIKWRIIEALSHSVNTAKYLGESFDEGDLSFQLDTMKIWSRRPDRHIKLDRLDMILKHPPPRECLLEYMMSQYRNAAEIDQVIKQIMAEQTTVITGRPLQVLKIASAQTTFALFHDLENAQKETPHTYRAFFRVTNSKELAPNIIDLLIPDPEQFGDLSPLFTLPLRNKLKPLYDKWRIIEHPIDNLTTPRELKHLIFHTRAYCLYPDEYETLQETLLTPLDDLHTKSQNNYKTLIQYAKEHIFTNADTAPLCIDEQEERVLPTHDQLKQLCTLKDPGTGEPLLNNPWRKAHNVIREELEVLKRQEYIPDYQLPDLPNEPNA